MYIIGFIFKNFCCNLFFYRRFPGDMWLIFYYKFYYSFYYKAAENRGKQRITEDNGTFTKYREKAQKRYVSGLLKWLYYIIHKGIIHCRKTCICIHLPAPFSIPALHFSITRCNCKSITLFPCRLPCCCFQFVHILLTQIFLTLLLFLR